MKKYQIHRTVLKAEGHQTFEVEAKSEEEAREKFEKTGGEFVFEEVNVMGLDDVENCDIEEVEE